jgi:hypothetical protein
MVVPEFFSPPRRRTIVQSLPVSGLKVRCSCDEHPGKESHHTMTSERTQAYGRVVQTLAELGPTKLLPAEQSRVRDAADTLIFAADLAEARESLLDMSRLAEHLVNSGRWLEERVDRLVADLLGCGPEPAVLEAA